MQNSGSVVRAGDVEFVVNEIVATASRSGIGFRVAAVETAEPARVFARARRALGALGFVVVRPGARRAPGQGGSLAHRHVAVFCCGGEDRRPAAKWIRALSRASPRGHVAVLLGPHVRKRPWNPGLAQVRERALAYGATSGDAGPSPARSIAGFLAVGDLDRAEALAAGIRAEACVLGEEVPDAVEAQHAEILFWRGRSDVPPTSARLRQRAGHALESLLFEWLRERSSGRAHESSTVAQRIRRAGAVGILRWGEGKGDMHLVEGLPALLQLVQDADDDHAALVGGCAWVRRQSGADRVGVVDGDALRVIAGDGWSSADLASVDPATVVVPVRYGRAVIGRVLALGAEAARPAIEQAAQAMAALTAPALRARLDALALARDAHSAAPEILGTSPAIAAVREAVARAAGTSFPVLIEGESGTGKELVARAVHRLSPRRGRVFAAVNCAALTDELMEAELFGHARGAFTGALGTRTGLFESAHGGTLFLDEVGEMSPRGQAKLLRVLQEREIRRVGENTARAVDVRIVAATNIGLAEATARGAFRPDLLFRLAVVRLRVPPLRDRLEDLPLLAHVFWRQMAADRGHRARLGADAIAALGRHLWPGNIRELQNVIAALVVASPVRGRVGERHVRQVLMSASARDDEGVSLEEARQLAERRAVAAALARHGGRRVPAARELGLTRQGLTKALRRLGFSSVDPKAGVA